MFFGVDILFCLCYLLVLDVIGFTNESAMVKDFLNATETDSKRKNVLSGVVFRNLPSVWHEPLAFNAEYKLRFPSTLRGPKSKVSMNPFKNNEQWMTGYMFPVFPLVGPRTHATQGGPPGRCTVKLYDHSYFLYKYYVCLIVAVVTVTERISAVVVVVGFMAERQCYLQSW